MNNLKVSNIRQDSTKKMYDLNHLSEWQLIQLKNWGSILFP